MLEKLAEVLETRAGDEYELEHLPEGETKSVLAMLAIWGGITFTGSGVLVGGELAGNATLAQFLLGFGFGLFLLVILAVLLGKTTMDYGLSFHVTTRYFFGNVGSYIPSGVQVLTRIGWSAVELAFIAAFTVLALGIDSTGGYIAVVVVLGIIYTVTAFVGIDGLKWIAYVAIPLVTVVFIWGILSLGVDTTQMGQVENPMPMTEIIGLAIGLWIAGAIVAGDWLRYSDSMTTSFVSSFFALVAIVLFTTLLGFLTVFAAGTPNLPEAMIEAGLIVPAAVGLILLGWTTIDNQLYSASLGTSNILECRKWVSVLIVSALTIVIASFGVHALIIPYLELLGVLIPPIAAPWIVEYFLFKNEELDISFDQIETTVNWTAVIAWAIGASVAFVTPPVYVPPIVGFATTVVVYYVLAVLLSDTRLYALKGSGKPLP